jgi:hypothetical protein
VGVCKTKFCCGGSNVGPHRGFFPWCGMLPAGEIEPQKAFGPADFKLSVWVFQPTHFLCFTKTSEYPGRSIHAVLCGPLKGQWADSGQNKSARTEHNWRQPRGLLFHRPALLRLESQGQAQAGRERMFSSPREIYIKATGLDGPLEPRCDRRMEKVQTTNPHRSIQKDAVQFSLIHCTRGALWCSSRARQSRSIRIVNFAESISLLTCSAMERHC